MSDFVSAKDVFVQQNLASREEVLRFISERAAELGATSDADALYAAFIAREDMGETGMTDGFAVPHAKAEVIEQAKVIVVKNNKPLEWPSFDDKPIDIAIALMVPDGEAGTTHIKLLSKTAVLLMREEFKDCVRKSDDPQAIADAINKGISEE